MQSLIFIAILILGACSHSEKRQSLVAGEDRLAQGGAPYRYRLLTVSDSKEALDVLKNRREFLRHHYTPSYDPYFGSSRISASCAEKIHFGEIENSPDGHWVRARFTVDQNWNTIVCSETAVPVFYLLRFCAKSLTVHELWIQADDPRRLDPRKFECTGGSLSHVYPSR